MDTDHGDAAVAYYADLNKSSDREPMFNSDLGLVRHLHASTHGRTDDNDDSRMKARAELIIVGWGASVL